MQGKIRWFRHAFFNEGIYRKLFFLSKYTYLEKVIHVFIASRLKNTMYSGISHKTRNFSSSTLNRHYKETT